MIYQMKQGLIPENSDENMMNLENLERKKIFLQFSVLFLTTHKDRVKKFIEDHHITNT